LRFSRHFISGYTEQNGGEFLGDDPVLWLYQARLMGVGTYPAVRPLAPEGQTGIVVEEVARADEMIE